MYQAHKLVLEVIVLRRLHFPLLSAVNGHIRIVGALPVQVVNPHLRMLLVSQGAHVINLLANRVTVRVGLLLGVRLEGGPREIGLYLVYDLQVRALRAVFVPVVHTALVYVLLARAVDHFRRLSYLNPSFRVLLYDVLTCGFGIGSPCLAHVLRVIHILPFVMAVTIRVDDRLVVDRHLCVIAIRVQVDHAVACEGDAHI